MSPATVAEFVLLTVIAPLAAGMVARRAVPGFTERMAKPVSMVATGLLLAVVVPILFTAWSAIVSLIGNGTVLAIAAFIIAGLAAGHLLGGPDPEDRTVLAFSTAFRHPGIAIAIAGVNFPGQKLVTAAVLRISDLERGRVNSDPGVAPAPTRANGRRSQSSQPGIKLKTNR